MPGLRFFSGRGSDPRVWYSPHNEPNDRAEVAGWRWRARLGREGSRGMAQASREPRTDAPDLRAQLARAAGHMPARPALRYGSIVFTVKEGDVVQVSVEERLLLAKEGAS